jgi:hypothetical protein
MTARRSENMVTMLQAMASMYPATAHQSGDALPMVTIENFEALGAGARKVSKLLAIFYTPILTTQASLANWNTYATNHSFWSSGTGESKPNVVGDRINQVYHIDNVTGTLIYEQGDGLFAPLWQISPLTSNASRINFNLASNEAIGKDLVHLMTSGKPVVSMPMDVQTLLGLSMIEGPASLFMQPIFNGETGGDKVVGALTAVILWLDFVGGVRLQHFSMWREVGS